MNRAAKSALGRALNALRKTYGGGRPRVIRPCPKCGLELSAREMRAHKCDSAQGGRPRVIRLCPKCGLELSAREMRAHKCSKAKTQRA
jgi:hypothetical protein